MPTASTLQSTAHHGTTTAGFRSYSGVPDMRAMSNICLLRRWILRPRWQRWFEYLTQLSMADALTSTVGPLIPASSTEHSLLEVARIEEQLGHNSSNLKDGPAEFRTPC